MLLDVCFHVCMDIAVSCACCCSRGSSLLSAVRGTEGGGISKDKLDKQEGITCEQNMIKQCRCFEVQAGLGCLTHGE